MYNSTMAGKGLKSGVFLRPSAGREQTNTASISELDEYMDVVHAKMPKRMRLNMKPPIDSKRCSVSNQHDIRYNVLLHSKQYMQSFRKKFSKQVQ
jgi:hypothetical protein